jgi:PPP family 3-phenylpropionic acid transporter
MSKLIALGRQHNGSIRLVSLQFVSLAAVGVVAPFTNLYLTDSGFSATMIGTLLSVGAILALVLTPILNRIADKHLLHRRLYMIYQVGFIIALVIFANTSLHPLLIVGVLFLEVTISPSMTLAMQLTMTQLGGRAKSLLGQIRSFAALGFASAGLFAGQIFNLGGYSLLFWVGALFAALSIQMSTIFPDKPKIKEKRVETIPTKRKPAFYVLAVSQFFVMMGMRNSFAFIFIFFSQDLGIPTAEVGLWAALLAGLEIPFFILMDKILPKVQARWVYIFGILGMAAFNIWLGFVQSLVVLFVLLIFRALMWPSLHLTSFMVVSEVSDPRNVATNQALLQVTIPSLAMLLTAPAFGWVFDNLGSQGFFTLCSVMCIIGALVVLLGSRWFEKSPVELQPAA